MEVKVMQDTSIIGDTHLFQYEFLYKIEYYTHQDLMYIRWHGHQNLTNQREKHELMCDENKHPLFLSPLPPSLLSEFLVGGKP